MKLKLAWIKVFILVNFVPLSLSVPWLKYMSFFAPINKTKIASTQSTHSLIDCSQVLVHSLGHDDPSNFFQFYGENETCNVGRVDRHSLEVQPSLGLVKVMVTGNLCL